jgi:hypothetical protein
MDHYTVGDALMCMVVAAIVLVPIFIAMGGKK